MRNPLTVIGGNILRLQKKVEPASPLHRTYETILKENERLEAMVRDAATYSELYQKEPAISIEIFNNGKSPNTEEMENIFVPFYSSKPYGTGFGLPIAQLAAKKNMGELYLERVPYQGTKCIIQLPVPAKKKSTTVG